MKIAAFVASLGMVAAAPLTALAVTISPGDQGTDLGVKYPGGASPVGFGFTADEHLILSFSVSGTYNDYSDLALIEVGTGMQVSMATASRTLASYVTENDDDGARAFEIDDLSMPLTLAQGETGFLVFEQLADLSSSVSLTYGYASVGTDLLPEEPGVIPLPAAGWMLLSALGGVFFMKRRRPAA
jgi:hypothetical protein